MVAKQVSPDLSDLSLLLGSLVLQDNFYRRLKQRLDLTFLYVEVAPYYGQCGHQSIDPIVFFKLLLVGHLENLCSDRAIIRTSQLRLDILYFIDYSVGQPGAPFSFVYLIKSYFSKPQKTTTSLRELGGRL